MGQDLASSGLEGTETCGSRCQGLLANPMKRTERGDSDSWWGDQTTKKGIYYRSEARSLQSPVRGEGWCFRIGGCFLGVSSQNSSGLGYGHRVQLLPAPSCCGSPSTSGRKPEETAILSLKDGETEAQHQLMNHFCSFQRQTIITTPTPHQPSLLPLPNCFYGAKLHQRCC